MWLCACDESHRMVLFGTVRCSFRFETAGKICSVVKNGNIREVTTIDYVPCSVYAACSKAATFGTKLGATGIITSLSIIFSIMPLACVNSTAA